MSTIQWWYFMREAPQQPFWSLQETVLGSGNWHFRILWSILWEGNQVPEGLHQYCDFLLCIPSLLCIPYYTSLPSYGFGHPLPSFQSAGFGIEPILGWGCVASFTVASNGWQSRNWSSTAESPQSNSGGNSPCDALEGSFLWNPTLTHQSSYPMINNLINLVGISMAKYDSNKIKPLTDW